jgi:hypothetical protein
LSAVEEVKLKFEPNLCEFVSLFPEERQTEMLQTLVRPLLDVPKSNRNSHLKVELLTSLFSKFHVATLVEHDLHHYLYSMIRKEPYIQFRKDAAIVLGRCVIAPLIKNKKYRKDLTDFTDLLRTSTNFRDRQMYITVAEATFEADCEVYKKHFAKAIGGEMKDEKLTVVQILLAKLCAKVPKGYSKSTDAIAETLTNEGNPEVV